MRPQARLSQLVEQWAAKAGGLAERGTAEGRRTLHFTLMGGETRQG
jgi:hypothetical protein